MMLFVCVQDVVCVYVVVMCVCACVLGTFFLFECERDILPLCVCVCRYSIYVHKSLLCDELISSVV